ncbi:hypothetical protein EVAR_44_1 [Eumeta japonica]|uniref:Uncharacterized protein n=1 Tax=Eumeta variegata TaxID=151549 RepID=A0A4C1S7V8_EUMVA|nr:hypothetical protein EVAR_44_1 [Eumeta japonica]
MEAFSEENTLHCRPRTCHHVSEKDLRKKKKIQPELDQRGAVKTEVPRKEPSTECHHCDGSLDDTAQRMLETPWAVQRAALRAVVADDLSRKWRNENAKTATCVKSAADLLGAEEIKIRSSQLHSQFMSEGGGYAEMRRHLRARDDLRHICTRCLFNRQAGARPQDEKLTSPGQRMNAQGYPRCQVSMVFSHVKKGMGKIHLEIIETQRHFEDDTPFKRAYTKTALLSALRETLDRGRLDIAQRTSQRSAAATLGWPLNKRTTISLWVGTDRYCNSRADGTASGVDSTKYSHSNESVSLSIYGATEHVHTLQRTLEMFCHRHERLIRSHLRFPDDIMIESLNEFGVMFKALSRAYEPKYEPAE